MTSSPNEVERVRRHTDPAVNAAIDQTIRDCVQKYVLAPKDSITERLEELDQEFDIERVLQMNASVIAMTGVALGAAVSRRWLALPAVVLTFLFQHATQGWCPPMPLFRRLGVRTRSEIERERFVLKFLRGDFDHLDFKSARSSTDALLAAAAQ